MTLEAEGGQEGSCTVVEIIAEINSKNQITVPTEVRRRFGVGAFDSIGFFFMKSRAIEVRKPRFDLESIIGSVPALPGASPDFERGMEEATAEEAQRIVIERI